MKLDYLVQIVRFPQFSNVTDIDSLSFHILIYVLKKYLSVHILLYLIIQLNLRIFLIWHPDKDVKQYWKYMVMGEFISADKVTA